MKAKKFHNLPSANWRTRTASGAIQYEFEGLRNRGSNVYLRAGEDGHPSSAKRTKLTFLYLSIPCRPSMEWMMPTHVGKSGLLYSVFKLKS